MAKEKMVTRTIISTEITVMALRLPGGTVAIEKYAFPGKLDNIETALTYVRKTYETETRKIAAVQSIELCETLYGMPESVFIKNAQILPPRTQNDAE